MPSWNFRRKNLTDRKNSKFISAFEQMPSSWSQKDFVDPAVLKWTSEVGLMMEKDSEE